MPSRYFLVLTVSVVLLVAHVFVSPAAAQLPPELKRWLGPQNWRRDVNGPILSLGKSGHFDDTHIFAPMVAWDKDQFLLWYCGSQGFAHDLSKKRTVDERVFKLGLAGVVTFLRTVRPLILVV